MKSAKRSTAGRVRETRAKAKHIRQMLRELAKRAKADGFPGFATFFRRMTKFADFYATLE